MNKVLQKPIRPEQMRSLLEQFIQSTPAVVKFEPGNAYSGLGSSLPDTEEQLFQLDSYPVLDIQNGIRLLGSEELLIELLGQLINENFPKDITALELAFREKNWPVSIWSIIRKQVIADSLLNWLRNYSRSLKKQSR